MRETEDVGGGDNGGEGDGCGSENGNRKAFCGGSGWGDGKIGSGEADGGGGGGSGGMVGGKVIVSREEVISNLVELFKEVGIQRGV